MQEWLQTWGQGSQGGISDQDWARVPGCSTGAGEVHAGNFPQ